MQTVLTTNQKKVFGWKEYRENGQKYRIKAHVRYDDECNNGHNSFSITGEIEHYRGNQWREDAGGCIHDEITKHFPELAPFIKWHLCSSDTPLHYLANTLYLAGTKDCWGLEKGESRQIRKGGTGLPTWILEEPEERIEKYVDAEECPTKTITLRYVPFCKIGKGKEPELEAARCAAIWPDATLEQLQNKELLEARLPKLMEEFQQAIELLGFIY